MNKKSKAIAQDLAEHIEAMLPSLAQPPKPGYTRRAMIISVEDLCEAGGIEVDSVELEGSEPAVLLDSLAEAAQR